MPDGSSLEYVVRPYQSPDAHGAIIIPSTPSGSRQAATLKWGAQCTVPDITGGMSFQVVCCKDQLGEQKRENYPPQRMYQNNDPTSANWVDYAPTKTMELTKKEKNSCGDNWDDISGVAQAIDSDLAGWQSLMDQVTGTSDKNCAQAWSFKPQAAG